MDTTPEEESPERTAAGPGPTLEGPSDPDHPGLTSLSYPIRLGKSALAPYPEKKINLYGSSLAIQVIYIGLIDAMLKI